MSNEEKLIRERAGRRSRCTLLIKNVDDEFESTPPTAATIENFINELKRQRAKVIELDDAIPQVIEDDQVEGEIASASDMIMKINMCISKSSIHSTAVTPANSVKLPNIKLDKFNGDPLKWSTFWDMYKTSIHERTDIAIPAKFHYLVSQMEGEAARLLAGFDNLAAEYNEAIDLLQKTNGKEKLIIQASLNALFDMASPEPTSISLSKKGKVFYGQEPSSGESTTTESGVNYQLLSVMH